MTQIINDFIDKNGFDAPYDIDDTCITSCTFDNGCLIGFCAIRGNELTGFVADSYRHHGIFSRLVRTAADKFFAKNSDSFLYFEAPSFYESLIKKHDNIKYYYSEYLMELDFNDYTRLKCAVPEGLHEYESFFSDDNTDYLLYMNDDAAEPCAVCSIDYGEKQTCIYDVYVDEDMRNKGVGTFFIANLLNDYFENNKNPLVLQVSSKNAEAVKLYEKAGFNITEQLDYCALYKNPA